VLAPLVALMSMFLGASLLVTGQSTIPLPQPQPVQVKQQSRTSATSDLNKEVRLNTDPDNPEPPYGMVLIPTGEVVIGTEVDNIPKLGDQDQFGMLIVTAETPRHTVSVEQFFLDETAVTNLQWKVFLDAMGREPSELLVKWSWPGGEIPEGQEYYPISLVSLPEIEEFLAWSGKRLPTEVEWTRAARGDDSRSYPWGDKWNSKVVSYGGRTPNMPVAVTDFEAGASPFGVLNMSGNVWEWVDASFTPYEGFEPYQFKKSKRERISLTPEFDSRRRVAKGGCFASPRRDARIDYRLSLDPNDSDAGLGFRTARSVLPGAEVIRSGYRRLLPSLIKNEDILDKTDVFSQERASYLEGSDGRIISGFRYLAFAHPKPERQAGLARMRKSSKDEPVTLGLLSTSEPLADPALPPGDYVVAFKARGESKKHRASRRGGGGKDQDDEPAPAPNGDSNGDGDETTGNGGRGGIAPWPGVAVHDVLVDIEFDQDMDVFLFYNVNNAVVGWTPSGDITESAFEKAAFDSNDDGKEWRIEFSLDVVSRRVPRFTLPIKLDGPGLGKGK
jgi:formylglycine-generating enzyme required for sulfatase activity